MSKMGATILDRENQTIDFRVFAFQKKGVNLIIKHNGDEISKPMVEENPHVFHVQINDLGLEPEYKFNIEEEGSFPDPYSNFQPEGVHGFSRVVDHAQYNWQDNGWKGMDLEQWILYELHVGTFTSEGTFQAITDRLDYLLTLGVNVIELMPITQTPGRWNWGYDGTNFFCVNHNYGTPADLKTLLDSCHQKGIAVILDVVYNHLGPEGNYLPAFGPYFTSKHVTPWGAAVNFDDAYSAFTRQMVLDSVRHWLIDYRFDGLRLDAVHTIIDKSPKHILQEIAEEAQIIRAETGRKVFMVAESDENNVQLINPIKHNGYGMDTQWMDDFHHCIHTLLTDERNGYYMDYGKLAYLEKVYKNFLYTGEFSLYWQKNRGTDASDNPGRQFVVCLQNHDQVGNRAVGERLCRLVEFSFLKTAAGLLFLSPYLPLLFAGEEYAENNPFLFFTDFIDPMLKASVSKGRMEEFKSFGWKEVPDPEDDQTFYTSKLTPIENWNEQNQFLFNFYRDLITLRKTHPSLQKLDKANTHVQTDESNRSVTVTRNSNGSTLMGLFNLGNEAINIAPQQPPMVLHSEWKCYGGAIEKGKGVQSLPKGSMVLFESRAP